MEGDDEEVGLGLEGLRTGYDTISLMLIAERHVGIESLLHTD